MERTYRDDDDVGIAYIYCNYKEEQLSENLIGSLLRQLLQRRSYIPEDIRTLYESHKTKKTRLSIREYSRLLQSETHSISKVFIIIDALDECHKNNEIRQTLLSELHKLRSSLQILITSRPEIINIKDTFDDFSQLEVKAIDADIKNYIEERIAKTDRLKRLIEGDTALQDMISRRIRDNVKGM